MFTNPLFAEMCHTESYVSFWQLSCQIVPCQIVPSHNGVLDPSSMGEIASRKGAGRGPYAFFQTGQYPHMLPSVQYRNTTILGVVMAV